MTVLYPTLPLHPAAKQNFSGLKRSPSSRSGLSEAGKKGETGNLPDSEKRPEKRSKKSGLPPRYPASKHPMVLRSSSEADQKAFWPSGLLKPTLNCYDHKPPRCVSPRPGEVNNTGPQKTVDPQDGQKLPPPDSLLRIVSAPASEPETTDASRASNPGKTVLPASKKPHHQSPFLPGFENLFFFLRSSSQEERQSSQEDLLVEHWIKALYPSEETEELETQPNLRDRFQKAENLVNAMQYRNELLATTVIDRFLDDNQPELTS